MKRVLSVVVVVVSGSFGCAPTVSDEGPEAVGSTVSVEKRGDGRVEISSRPVGIDCEIDCTEQEFAFAADVDSVDVVVEAFPGAQLIRAFCTAPDQETVVADLSGGDDDVRMTVPTIVDGAHVDWRCVSEHRQVHTLDIFFRGNGEGSVKGSLSSSTSDESIKRIDCGDDCSGAYFVGDIETLTATPDEGSVFVRWGLCDELLDDDTAATITVTVTEDLNCEATFAVAP